MDILLIQFAEAGLVEPLPRFDNALGIAAAVMRREGMEPHLATLGAFDERRLAQAVKAHRPRWAVVDIDPFSITAARRTIGQLAAKYALPVVVVGRYGTCCPEGALSIPGTQAVLIGEYDLTLCAYLQAAQAGEDLADLPGVWVNAEEGLVRGELPELTGELDELPFADRDLFDYERIVQTTGEVHFKALRGCPQWCAYCINDWYMDLYARKGPFVRRRGVEHLLAEVEAVVARYGRHARQAVFYDHAFADDSDWLRLFADRYPRRCALPYRCHVRLNRVDPERAALLALSNCRDVTVTLAAGSNFIRDEVFTMQTDSADIDLGVQTLRQAGLRITAEVFVGAPYESEITVEETVRRLRLLAPEVIETQVFYPVPGSRAAEMCREAGWISGRPEEHYWRQCSTLDMPSLPTERIDELAGGLERAVRQPRAGRFAELLTRIRRRRKASLHEMGARRRRRSVRL